MSAAPETAGGRSPAPEFFIIAGEVSGDLLGGKLIEALRARLGGRVRFRGVGGAAMQAAGLESLFPLEDIAVMGFLPVVARLPRLLNRIGATARAALADPPTALIVIDSPDFTHRVARRVRAQRPQLPVINYVSPSVWAWRPGRAARMRGYVDHILALLPFEPASHAELGGPPCTYVGHPLIERLDELRPGPTDLLARGASPPSLLVLPGSRRSEIARLLDVFGETLSLLRDRIGAFEANLPAVDHLVDEIERRVADWPIAPRIIRGETAKFAAFRRARAALAASGTVTLELALAQVPTVVAYKVTRIEEFIARRMIATPWIALPNIILGEEAFPEMLQDRANPLALAGLLADIMPDGAGRERQMAALARLEPLMRLAGDEAPSVKAAEIVLRIAAGQSLAGDSAPQR